MPLHLIKMIMHQSTFNSFIHCKTKICKDQDLPCILNHHLFQASNTGSQGLALYIIIVYTETELMPYKQRQPSETSAQEVIHLTV